MTSLPGWKGSQREGAGRVSRRGTAADMAVVNMESEDSQGSCTKHLTILLFSYWWKGNKSYLLQSITCNYHRRFYHMFTLKYVQIDTFETSIYIRLYYIYRLSLQMHFICRFCCRKLSPMDLAFFDEIPAIVTCQVDPTGQWVKLKSKHYLPVKAPMVRCFFFSGVFLGDELKTAQKPTQSSFFGFVCYFF